MSQESSTISAKSPRSSLVSMDPGHPRPSTPCSAAPAFEAAAPRCAAAGSAAAPGAAAAGGSWPRRRWAGDPRGPPPAKNPWAEKWGKHGKN